VCVRTQVVSLLSLVFGCLRVYFALARALSYYSDLLFQADYFYSRLLGLLIFIRIIRVVRVVLVIIFVGQFKLLVLLLLVLESMV
jgi:hypothetical protein